MNEYIIAPKEKIVVMADKVRENNEALTIDDIAEKIVGSGGEILKFFGCENYEILPFQKVSNTGYITTKSNVLVSDIKFLCLISNRYLSGTDLTAGGKDNDDWFTVLTMFKINLNNFTQDTYTLQGNPYLYSDAGSVFNSGNNIWFPQINYISSGDTYYDDPQGYTCLLMY